VAFAPPAEAGAAAVAAEAVAGRAVTRSPVGLPRASRCGICGARLGRAHLRCGLELRAMAALGPVTGGARRAGGRPRLMRSTRRPAVIGPDASAFIHHLAWSARGPCLPPPLRFRLDNREESPAGHRREVFTIREAKRAGSRLFSALYSAAFMVRRRARRGGAISGRGPFQEHVQAALGWLNCRLQALSKSRPARLDCTEISHTSE